jgi:hypothetical protein
MRKILQVPFEVRRPFRLWMTGSIAVVMAAVMPIRGSVSSDRSPLMRLLRHSHFGVNETVRRLEASARDQGLPVLMLLHGERPVLVLASSVGGTPVVMQEADSSPAMPLSLLVRGARAGGADVLVADSGWLDLPETVAGELASLPRLVDRALT